jgi:hypothetical protein
MAKPFDPTNFSTAVKIKVKIHLAFITREV